MISGRGCTLRFLIVTAYHLQRFQIVGGPKWIDTAYFDLAAKPPGGAAFSDVNPAQTLAPPSEEQRQMLQSLLVERFHLRAHQSQREGKISTLRVMTKGAHLVPAKDPKTSSWIGYGSHVFLAENTTMALLSERLSGLLNRPVRDETQLTGSYDFNVEQGSPEDESHLGASIESALHTLGLELKTAPGRVEELIVDEAQLPSPN